MATKQHTYAAAETTTEEVARVDRIVITPGVRVEVVVKRGELVDGGFVAHTRGVTSREWGTLPAAVIADLLSLESRALAVAETDGIIPSGTTGDV